MRHVWNILNDIESIICRLLLLGFVCLLFIQIVSREVFSHSITWIEELSVFMFVWFVYFGASCAAKLSAHNRVTFQFKMLSPKTVKYVEAFADLFWVFFNVYFIYLAYDFVFNRMNTFWKSQTLGIQYKYIYMVLPIAFVLMTFRVLQVNYDRLIRGADIEDPEKVDLEKIEKEFGDSESSEK